MSRPHVVAPSELSALRDLELLARTTVEGLRQGLHRSPFHGYSAEFSQYRHYRPGDDLKHVDWKAFGRTDRLYSRQFRETTNLGAFFVVDASRSMAFPEVPPTKFDLAKAAAAVLGALIIDQGDGAGLLALTGPGRDDLHYLPARSGRHHLHVFLAALARLASAGAEPVSATLRRVGTVLRRRGLIVVVSDFYEEETTLAELRRLRRMGHDIVAVHILAAGELVLDAVGPTEFVDLETGATLLASAEVAANDYARAIRRFVDDVQRAIEREGFAYLRLTTNEPLEPALRRFLVGRRGGA
jgi:uncharacterized protein (DUF58 family)